MANDGAVKPTKKNITVFIRKANQLSESEFSGLREEVDTAIDTLRNRLIEEERIDCPIWWAFRYLQLCLAEHDLCSEFPSEGYAEGPYEVSYNHPTMKGGENA